MSTTEDDSKTVARDFYEGYNTHDLRTVFARYIADGMVNHAMGGAVGADTWLQYDEAAVVAMPDLTMTVFEQAADGDKVFTHWALEGTHTADFLGKPPTGNRARLEAVTIDIIQDGKIVEHNLIGDSTQFMAQFETN